MMTPPKNSFYRFENKSWVRDEKSYSFVDCVDVANDEAAVAAPFLPVSILAEPLTGTA